jgi:hypothetical protein
MFVAFAAMCVTASAQSAGMKKYADEAKMKPAFEKMLASLKAIK